MGVTLMVKGAISIHGFNIVKDPGSCGGTFSNFRSRYRILRHEQAFAKTID